MSTSDRDFRDKFGVNILGACRPMWIFSRVTGNKARSQPGDTKPGTSLEASEHEEYRDLRRPLTEASPASRI